MHADGLSFWDALRDGIFTVPGDPEGMLDLDPVLKILGVAGYEGWLAVEAEQESRRAIAKNRWVPQPHLSLGAVMLRKKDYVGAIAAFSEAVKISPQDWSARLSLADAFGELPEEVRQRLARGERGTLR